MEIEWGFFFLFLCSKYTEKSENSKPSSEKKNSARGFWPTEGWEFLRSVTESWGDVWVKKYKLLVRWATEGGSRKKKSTMWKRVDHPHTSSTPPPLPLSRAGSSNPSYLGIFDQVFKYLVQNSNFVNSVPKYQGTCVGDALGEASNR